MLGSGSEEPLFADMAMEKAHSTKNVHMVALSQTMIDRVVEVGIPRNDIK